MKLVIVFALFALFLEVESRSYPFHVELSNVFDLHWAYNATNERLYFKVAAVSKGWAALALTLEKGGKDMMNYDIALGAVWPGNSSLTFGIKDYWSFKKEIPKYDSKQDLILLRGEKTDGKIEMEFSRKADTGDTERDIKITNDSVVYLAWARSDDSPTNVTHFNNHPDKYQKGRGHTTIGYNMFTGKAVETSSISSHLVPSLALLVQLFALWIIRFHV